VLCRWSRLDAPFRSSALDSSASSGDDHEVRGGVRVIVVSLVLALLCAGCDWAQYFSGPGHTGANPSEPAFTVSSGAHFGTAWSTSCICLPPLEAGGLVYVADGFGGVNPRNVTLRALDAATGTQQWSVVINQIDSAEFFAVGNGLAYVLLYRASHPDEILAFDAASGALRWSLTPPGPVNEGAIRHVNVVLDGATLFVGADDHASRSSLSAIDTAGSVVWSANPPGTLDGLVADSGRTVYVSSHVTLTNPPNTLVAFLTGYAESDGTLRSTIQLPGRLGVAFANGLAYTGSMAIHPDTGQVVWNAPGEAISVITGTVALTQSGSDLIARDATTGALRWSVVGGAPTAAGTQVQAIAGALVFVAHPHVIDVRSLQDGSMLGATPAVSSDVDLIPANGHLYVDGAGTLWAFAPTST
jgi:outer membrane protein assembly factor BamB